MSNQKQKFISLNVNDIPAYIADLKDQLERERLRLAACGVAAMSNTRETAERNRELHKSYKSASFNDVCAAVDREMALRERVAELEAQNHALKRQRDESDEECREANASWCREIEETMDLNQKLTAALKENEEAKMIIEKLEFDIECLHQDLAGEDL